MNTISATKPLSLHLSLDVQIPPHINTSYLPPNTEIQNAFNIFECVPLAQRKTEAYNTKTL